MDQHILHTRLKQLLRQGYSSDEIRNLVIAPRAVLERALCELQQQQRQQQNQASALRGQAEFAIRLRH
jgi:NADP-dependent 3-hydroxy acid dehydrogenase YdfG